MENLELREITSDDWESYRDFRLGALQSLDAKAFGGSYEKESARTEEDWKLRLDQSDRIFYGFFNNKEIISGGGVYFKKERGEWIITGVYTKTEFRGRGFSKKVIERIIEELKSKGVERVVLFVSIEQTIAINLYHKLGFKDVELVKDYPMADGKLHDEIMMEKFLD